MIQRLRSPWLALCALALFGCSSASDADPAPPPPASNLGPRARVLTLTLDLETDDVSAAEEALRALVAREEGYVERASSNPGHASLVLRVPAARLPAFRHEARRVAEVTRESEDVEDVTDQRVDLGARLSSARREEERLLALMSDRTDTLADVSAVEERLAGVRARIEQLDAQRAGLEQRIEYARVDVEVARARVAFWMEPWSTLGSAASWGVSAAQALAVGAGTVIVGLAPTALMLALGLLTVASVTRAVRLGLRRRSPIR